MSERRRRWRWLTTKTSRCRLRRCRGRTINSDSERAAQWWSTGRGTLARKSWTGGPRPIPRSPVQGRVTARARSSDEEQQEPPQAPPRRLIRRMRKSISMCRCPFERHSVSAHATLRRRPTMGIAVAAATAAATTMKITMTTERTSTETKKRNNNSSSNCCVVRRRNWVDVAVVRSRTCSTNRTSSSSSN